MFGCIMVSPYRRLLHSGSADVQIVIEIEHVYVLPHSAGMRYIVYRCVNYVYI